MALSTTQYGYIIDPMVPFTDGKGNTIKDGFVRVFVAGSSTPVITYRNFDGAANQDLIELDNSGRTKTSVIGSKGLTYKVCVYDQLHSQESPILTVDKVSVIGANITAGAGATVVTGLDGFRTKPDGFVDASVVGTDGYVALDHTLVTDDLNTDAKATAVENDRYIPLLNDDVNDPDSKMTLGRLWQWVLGHIKSLATSISTFRDGDYLFVDGSAGMAKMSKDDFLALIGNSQEIYQRLKEAMLRVDEIAGGIKPRIFGTNWFDQSNMLVGKWVSYENGTINDNPDYSCSQLTPIKESATYHAKNSVNGDQIAFYDINLDFVGGVLLSLQSDTEFHTPAGARFARYCTATTNLTPFYIVEDSAIMWKDPYHFRGWYEGAEIIVAKDGSGDFTTLTEAASYAVDGDVIHVKAGVYDNEAVQLFGKTVTVYGDGCLNTIVKNGWNTYSKAPIEMTTGVLRDIQFYAYDGGSPSQDPSGATAYALHVDSDTSYGKPFLVERCIFISEKGNNAVGVGIYGGCDFIFKDCQFIGGVSTPFYVHDSTNIQYVGVMDLELYNNTFVSFGNGCFGIDAARLNGTTVYLTACGNNFHDNGTPVGLPHLFTSEVLYPPDDQPGPATGNTNIGVVNWNTKPLNNGNNLPIFNGGYQYATQGADWITHGQFGTDRIADDAITAAKVKDNETLPVNISGNAGAALAAASGSALETAINSKLDNTGDASNTTASFTKASGDTSSIASGGKLSAIFGAISSFFASLKALAFKDSVSDSDIDSVAWSKVSSKPTKLSDFTDDITQQTYIASGTSSDKPASGAAVAQAVNAVSKLAGTRIGNGSQADLNDFISGNESDRVHSYYWVYSQKDNVSNKPADDSGQMLVMNYNDNNAIQIVITGSGVTYSRSKVAGTWTNWFNIQDASWINSGTFDAARIPTSLPDVTAGNANYAAKIGTSSAHPQIGSPSAPVYVDANGQVQPCLLSLPSTTEYIDLSVPSDDLVIEDGRVYVFDFTNSSGGSVVRRLFCTSTTANVRAQIVIRKDAPGTSCCMVDLLYDSAYINSQSTASYNVTSSDAGIVLNLLGRRMTINGVTYDYFEVTKQEGRLS